jgi:RNA polymerase sigma factor (sigma-70 family)
MENLTEKVLQYQKTGRGLREIVNEIGPRIYQFPRRTMGWDEDACGDFYVFIHPRLIRLLDRFRDQGRPFESYLWTVLNWQLRNFARDRSRAERRWHVSLRVDPGEGVSRDEDCIDSVPGPEDLAASAAIASCIRSGADRRNFLFLLLKSSRRLDPERAPALARLAGLSPEALLALASSLRDLRSSREARHEMFCSRRNKSYAAVRVREAELRTEVDPDRRAALQNDLDRMKRRMVLAMQKMSRVGLAPTNAEIGRVLGVPKGTVDSGLYWLKRKLASVYDAGTLRPAS